MDAFSVVSSLAYSLVLWVIIGAWLWRRAHAGAVVMRLGRDRTGLLVALLGVALIVAALTSAIEAPGTDLTPWLGGFSCGVYCLISGSTQMQIRERGILGGVPLFPHFLEWERIAGHVLEGTILSVTVKARRQIGHWRHSYQLNFHIPAQHGASVSDLLKAHCG